MSLQALSSYSFFLPDEAATFALGQRLASSLLTLCFKKEGAYARPTLPSLRIHLSGPLGAGKTALVRAILRGLGYEGRVKSPTYALLEPYSVSINETTFPVYRFDLYRLSSAEEWLELGFRDYMDAGALCLIEWPEQVGALLGPPDCLLTLKLDIEEGDSSHLLENSLAQTRSGNAQSLDISKPLAAENTSDQNALFALTGRGVIAKAFSQIGKQYLEQAFQ